MFASGDNEVHQVHGLTTAASVWLSAAAGVGAGGAEYFVSTYAVRKLRYYYSLQVLHHA